MQPLTPRASHTKLLALCRHRRKSDQRKVLLRRNKRLCQNSQVHCTLSKCLKNDWSGTYRETVEFHRLTLRGDGNRMRFVAKGFVFVYSRVERKDVLFTQQMTRQRRGMQYDMLRDSAIIRCFVGCSSSEADNWPLITLQSLRNVYRWRKGNCIVASNRQSRVSICTKTSTRLDKHFRYVMLVTLCVVMLALKNAIVPAAQEFDRQHFTWHLWDVCSRVCAWLLSTSWLHCEFLCWQLFILWLCPPHHAFAFASSPIHCIGGCKSLRPSNCNVVNLSDSTNWSQCRTISGDRLRQLAAAAEVHVTAAVTMTVLAWVWRPMIFTRLTYCYITSYAATSHDAIIIFSAGEQVF